MGLHASDTAQIGLDEVYVPDDAVLGEVGEGFKVAMSSLDSGRYSAAAGCVGICQGCVNESVAYAKEREQFGRPIGSFQLVQAMLADMKVQADAARMLVWRAGAHGPERADAIVTVAQRSLRGRQGAGLRRRGTYPSTQTASRCRRYPSQELTPR